MATHDYNIANQGFLNFRTDLNSALVAAASNNSNGTAPSTTFGCQFWADTATDFMKIRNEGNTLWHNLFMLNKEFGGHEASLGLNGWFTSPNGVMFQWVKTDIIYNSAVGGTFPFTVNFPYTFSTAWQAWVNPYSGLDTSMLCVVESISTSSCSVRIGYPVAKNFTVSIGVFAIGLRQ